MTKGQRRYMVQIVKKRSAIDRGATHTFPHAFCSYIANNGMPPLMAMKIIGHQSLDIILIYYHVEEQDLAQNFDEVRFENMLASPAELESKINVQ